MSNRTTGTILITAAACVFLYGIYDKAGTGWACLTGAFFLYVAGYHVMNKSEAQAERRGAVRERERLTTPITEARSHRGMN